MSDTDCSTSNGGDASTAAQALALEQTWYRSPDATDGIARADYFGLLDGSPLWVQGDRFKESRQGVLRRVLG